MSKRALFCAAFLPVLAFSLTFALSQVPRGQAQEECRTFPETGKMVCGKFLQYWLAHGGLGQHGFPISSELVEVSELDGRSYTVQYFERALFELHPENQPPNDVLLAQLGTLTYKRRYASGVASPTATAIPVPPTSTAVPPAPSATAAPPAPPATPSPAVAPPTTWVNFGEYAQGNGVTFVVYRADIERGRIDVYYLIENETAAAIPVTLSNADQLVADNDYNLYPPLDPRAVRSIVIEPGRNYGGMTTFLGNAYYNRAQFLTYGINNIPNLGNVRVRIQMPPRP